MQQDGVQIGEAAALYGLPPSTLRWWEKQAVLDPPRPAGRTRRYTNRDLRQVAMAYLCCLTGRMPLDRAAVVTSRTTDRATWRRVVVEQMDRLERRRAELDAAHEFLDHLLRCDEEVIIDCPHLDAGLPGGTPVVDHDLVTAARLAGRRRHRTEPPEEPPHAAEPGSRCQTCDARLPPGGGPGRPRAYCSRRCRQRAYRARRAKGFVVA